MKKIVLMLVIVFFVFSCKDKKQNEVSVTGVKIDSIELNDEQNSQIVRDTIRKFCAEDFYGILNENLVGVELLDETDKGKFNHNKYGVNFADVCYSNELIKINIKREIILISNYLYAQEGTKIIKIISCDVINDSLIIKTESKEISEILISKTDDSSVFSLSHKGEYLVKINEDIEVRVSNFLIKEKNLEKFGGIPDCGDFDG